MEKRVVHWGVHFCMHCAVVRIGVDCTVHLSCESTLGHHTHACGDLGGRENEFVGCSQRVVRAHKFQFFLAPQVVLVDCLVGHLVVGHVCIVLLFASAPSWRRRVSFAWVICCWPSWALNAAGGQPNSQSALCVSASPERLP